MGRLKALPLKLASWRKASDCWVELYMPVISALWRLKEEGQEVKISISYLRV